MDGDSLRRLILNLNASILLAHHCGDDAPSKRQVNRAVQAAREVDGAVRKRLRWELRLRKSK